MARLTVSRGRIVVHESMTPYDAFVRDFLATMGGIQGVLVSGYTAILLGRSRQTEDIDMLLAPLDRAAFDAWWQRLEDAGFWCLNAGKEEAWSLLQEHLAPRWARSGSLEPNMEVKVPRDATGRATLEAAWELDLLGQPGRIGDLSDQVGFKLYMATAGLEGPLRVTKDLEDAVHIAKVAGKVLDWSRVERMASILEVPIERVQELQDLVA